MFFQTICGKREDWYAAEAAKNEENGQNGQLKNVLKTKLRELCTQDFAYVQTLATFKHTKFLDLCCHKVSCMASAVSLYGCIHLCIALRWRCGPEVPCFAYVALPGPRCAGKPGGGPRWKGKPHWIQVGSSSKNSGASSHLAGQGPDRGQWRARDCRGAKKMWWQKTNNAANKRFETKNELDWWSWPTNRFNRFSQKDLVNLWVNLWVNLCLRQPCGLWTPSEKKPEMPWALKHSSVPRWWTNRRSDRRLLNFWGQELELALQQAEEVLWPRCGVRKQISGPK